MSMLFTWFTGSKRPDSAFPSFSPVSQPFNTSLPEYEQMQNHCAGRALLAQELPYDQKIVETYVQAGVLQKVSAITQQGSFWRCLRCSNQSPGLFGSHACACGRKRCVYCRECLEMGRVSSCTPLYFWTGTEAAPVFSDPLAWNGRLSSGQERASCAAIEASRRKQELYIWAVCGAGKTEMMFQAVAEALARGERVLWATPRTDVVRELYPRLAGVFPDVPTAAWYAGSLDARPEARLVLATAHQARRFKGAFDVAVIDEVDAFPYVFDPGLQQAVREACRQEKAVIYLSATPGRNEQRRMKSGDLAYVRVPRRFHGQPLPVPVCRWAGNWKLQLSRGRLPHALVQWCRARDEDFPLFIFVPSVAVIRPAVEAIRTEGFRCDGVHAEDEKREEKITAFRDGNIDILVTTTILERGVTIPKADVAVLGADDDIFTESALVQIAGRAGRNPERPEGDVVFFHYGRTKAIQQTIRHIQTMNREEAASNE
ncbi:DEAD/DEAH box helicase [Marinococcus luteus]|uniref:DEAD/DEAH box helicase n=1 Tax=Marinococcus luteus TaxID=1122204 RepID=UPI002ACCD84B|nr:DEAD/DEAH box helicase [Marinococcus luteus]MDZ5784082.1 DEAD/DEAH box helicase [Marinococcus luteus]